MKKYIFKIQRCDGFYHNVYMNIFGDDGNEMSCSGCRLSLRRKPTTPYDVDST